MTIDMLTTNSFTYSRANDLLMLRDDKAQTTTWAYNGEGNVTNKWDANSVSILQYLYDANGRLTNRWSKAKGNTRYLYDPVGNLTNVVYPASTQIKLRYNALNRLTNLVDAAGTTAYRTPQAGSWRATP